MEIEKLIKLVKNKPILYNKNHKNYRKNEFKIDIWKDIGKQLNLSGEKCKYKWKCLRTQYSREKETRNVPDGTAPVKKKEWKYFEMLQFLDDFLESRPTHPNVSSSSFNIEPVTRAIHPNENSSSCNIEPVNLLELDDTMEAFEDIYNKNLPSKRSSKNREGRRRRAKVKGDLENCIQNLMTEITRVDKEADNEVDLYFKSIAKIVKDQKLTSLQFLQIQGKLTLTLKTELENMH